PAQFSSEHGGRRNTIRREWRERRQYLLVGAKRFRLGKFGGERRAAYNSIAQSRRAQRESYGNVAGRFPGCLLELGETLLYGIDIGGGQAIGTYPFHILHTVRQLP